MIEPIEPKKHWYKTWWGTTLIVVFYVFIILILAMGMLVFNYWQLIKAGKGDEIGKMFYPQVVQKEDGGITLKREALETDDSPYLGNPEADLVIVAFMDFRCPFCKEQSMVLQQIAARHGSKIKIIFKHFPIELSYPGTMKLSAISACAHEQGAFWAFYSYFFANQESLPVDLSMEVVDNLSAEFGVDGQKIRECMNAGRGEFQMRKDLSAGNLNGVTQGTPTYFVNGYILPGAQPLENWETIINHYENQ